MQENIDNIIKLAWCDKTSFEKIKRIHGITESEVIKIMRKNLIPRSFKLWRTRVTVSYTHLTLPTIYSV